MHGLDRALINNMVVGVSEGFKKELELVGVGYKAANQGNVLELNLGYSHNIFFALPDSLTLATETAKGQNPKVTVEGAAIELTSYEYKILEYLMMHPQEVISKTKLTDHIYEQDFERDSNVIEVFIGRLRKKIDPNGSYKPIETLRGRGYRFSIQAASE